MIEDYQRGVEDASAIYSAVISDYVAENAKLREEVVDLRKNSQTYEAENSKLRELVRHMHECMSNVDADGNHECFVCEYENAECEFDHRMRELGVGE